MCGTDQDNYKFIATHDWYYSLLNRRLMEEYYSQTYKPMSQEILEDFRVHDSLNIYEQRLVAPSI